MSDSFYMLLSAGVLLSVPLVSALFLYETVKSYRLVTRGCVVQGEITAVRWRRTNTGRRIAHPTIMFVTARGKRVEHSSGIGFFPAQGDVGATIRIRYMPDQPGICAIDDFSHLWLGPIVLAIMSITLVAYSVLVLNRCAGQNLLACMSA